MKQIVINDINEIDKLKGKLKKIKIWVCSSSTGKTYLSNLDNRFFDLDVFQSTLPNDQDVEKKVIAKMFEVINDGKIAINASHKFFVSYLSENNIPYGFVYGKPEVQDEYVWRMLHRGSGQEFVNLYGNVAERYLYKVKDKRPKIKIELKQKEYLSECLWKIFGKQKKYIQFKNFSNNKFKIAFVDLDGTLLDIRGELTQFTIDTIKNLKSKIKVVLTSGRSKDSVMPFVEKLGLNDKENYVICGNGSLIANGCGENLLFNKISKAKLELFISNFGTNLSNCYFNTDKGRKKFVEIDNIKNFIKTNQIYKIVYIKENAEQIKISAPIADNFYIYGGNRTLQFVNLKSKKEIAVKKVLKMCNLKKENAVAFGDSLQDLQMIKAVGCGIAVCNALPEIKDAARYITDSNNDEGVALALLKIKGQL